MICGYVRGHGGCSNGERRAKNRSARDAGESFAKAASLEALVALCSHPFLLIVAASALARRPFGFLGGRNKNTPPPPPTTGTPLPEEASDLPPPQQQASGSSQPPKRRFFRPSTATPSGPTTPLPQPNPRHSIALPPNRTPTKANTTPAPASPPAVLHHPQRSPTADLAEYPLQSTETPASSSSMTAEHPPTRASLRAWWQNFTNAQKFRNGPNQPRSENDPRVGASIPLHRLRVGRATYTYCVLCGSGVEEHAVFGKPLKESLKYASVQISTANSNGELYVWGYIPVVVAKWYVTVLFTSSSSSNSQCPVQWTVSEREWCVSSVM